MRGLILVSALALAGCTTQEDVRSLTYDYGGQHRLAAERRAAQEMQDSCYFSGYQYAEPEGPPKILRVDGGQRLQATQSFSCVGTAGGP